MNRTRAFALSCTLFLAPLAFSQGPSTPPSPAGGPQIMRDHGGMEGRGGGRGGMMIVPPGTWWKSPEVIKDLALTPDQQKHLDDIFLQSRIQLIHMHASLEEEQLKLQPLLDTNPPDQGRALAEISKIADLRADLEKADAKMLLSLRGVLTADQWTKLRADRHHGREGEAGTQRPNDMRWQGRQGAQDGPGGPGGPPASMESMPEPPSAE